MTSDEILRGLYDETLVGNGPRVLELTREGLNTGMAPETMLRSIELLGTEVMPEVASTLAG